MADFAELGLSPQLVSSLTALGFEEPTPIQEAAIPAILAGSDVLGQAATGTGKTAAFALPLIERWALGKEPSDPVILVLTPTRELCLQVSESFHSYGRDAGIIVTPIYGGQEYGRQIRSLKRGTHVVVATPGRALDHINRGTLKLDAVKAVVLDEADEMLDLGFADELDAIFEALPEGVQTALFSATLPPRIAKIADEHLKNPVRIAIAKEETPEGEAPRSGKIDAIVATDVAARGIDLENLTHVINFGIPASYETYVHRIGRTGRAGRTGTAITILEPREHRHIRALERATRSKIEIRTVPSATDVQAKRLEVTRGAIAEILAQGGLERYNVIVEALCEEHDPIEVAAAAVRLALESEGTNDDDMEIPAFGDRRDRRERSERPERPRRERGEPEEGMTRLFIGAGRMSGVRPGDIVGAIANEANVSSRQIGAIDISDRFTLAEVDSAVAQQVIDALQGVRFKGRPITVKLDQGAPREERSDRGRSDRFEREGRNDRYDRPERKRFDRDDRSERYSRFDDDNRRRGPRR